jgi:hypothetical protein
MSRRSPPKLHIGQLVKLDSAFYPERYTIGILYKKLKDRQSSVVIQDFDDDKGFIVLSVHRDHIQPLTRDHVTEGRYNEAQQFQAEMENTNIGTPSKVKRIRRTDGGSKKHGTKKRRRTMRK